MKRFKLDENLPASAATILREAGHDVITVSDQRLGGADDRAVLKACIEEARTLVTLDLDFADARSHRYAISSGIVVVRVPRQDAPLIRSVMERALSEFEREPLNESIWIVEPGRVRIWREGG